MRNKPVAGQLARVSLKTGNWIAWIAVAAIAAFCAGWIVHAITRPLFCFIAA